MSPTRTVAAAVDVATERALLRWEAFKRAHPATADAVAPFLRRLWRLALPRRPRWAEMRERQLFKAWSDPWRSSGSAPAVGAVGARVDDHHVIEDRDRLVAARVEHAWVVPAVGAFIAGWLFDPRGHVSAMTVRTGGTSSADLLADMVRIGRPDVAEAYRSWTRSADGMRHGFACLARLDGASTSEITTTLSLELAGRSGESWHLSPRPVVYDEGGPLAVIRDILTIVPPRDPAVLDRHIGPTVSALWGTRERLEPVVEIGEPRHDPGVSIVVPIYKRYDFIEYQMALFADDPDIQDAELIYVIDDPLITDEVLRLCRAIHPIFKVPCRLVLCTENHGFAGATNVGARLAKGKTLLLLNSDVIPAYQGWLSQLRAAYASLPAPGVLGPRLLFPDGSLQHQGIEFEQAPWFPGIWLNEHPGKGLPAPPSDATEPESVAAVTAACMMVSRDLFRKVGGLDEGYVIGDFEDSDFCLQLRELGHASYVAPWVTLYHLERQSQILDGDPDWRQALTLYNAWRHTRRWAHVLGPGPEPAKVGTNGASVRA